MQAFTKLSIAIMLTITIPMLIPTRTLQYYWLLLRRRWRYRTAPARMIKGQAMQDSGSRRSWGSDQDSSHN